MIGLWLQVLYLVTVEVVQLEHSIPGLVTGLVRLEPASEGEELQAVACPVEANLWLVSLVEKETPQKEESQLLWLQMVQTIPEVLAE
jgi:hypothetical protein